MQGLSLSYLADRVLSPWVHQTATVGAPVPHFPSATPLLLLLLFFFAHGNQQPLIHECAHRPPSLPTLTTLAPHTDHPHSLPTPTTLAPRYPVTPPLRHLNTHGCTRQPTAPCISQSSNHIPSTPYDTKPSPFFHPQRPLHSCIPGQGCCAETPQLRISHSYTARKRKATVYHSPTQTEE